MTYEEQFIRDMATSLRARRTSGSSGRRSFAAAQASRLASGWTTSNLSGDAELRYALKSLRARARDLGRNNDYAKKFIRMVVINVLGHTGITFQSKAKLKGGGFDERANTAIEADWTEWGKRINAPDVTGKHSWRGIQRLVLRSLAREGECLVRIVRGYDNKLAFSLQLIDIDHLNEDINAILPNGNKIKMGVEMDTWGRPVAYHISVTHPGEYMYPLNIQKTDRIPAEDIIHIFDPDRIGDSRGLTPMHSSMSRMNMLGGYEEAELVAARLAAAKMGFYQSKDGEPPVGDDTDDQGNFITEAEPGTFDVVPNGYEMKTFDPQHPAGNFPPFVKQMLRGMASGLGVSYNSLASDLESVNYSSARTGTLEERDNWRDMQAHVIESFHDMVYAAWLKMWLTMPSNTYGLTDFDRLYAPKWTARTWAWVDPLKDQKANSEGLESGLSTYTDVLAEQGKDFEEHVGTLAYEKEYLKKKGLDFTKKQKSADPAADAMMIDEDMQPASGKNTGGSGNGN